MPPCKLSFHCSFCTCSAAVVSPQSPSAWAYSQGRDALLLSVESSRNRSRWEQQRGQRRREGCEENETSVGLVWIAAGRGDTAPPPPPTLTPTHTYTHTLRLAQWKGDGVNMSVSRQVQQHSCAGGFLRLWQLLQLKRLVKFFLKLVLKVILKWIHCV